MQPWSGFFGVLAACAATLLGLLFVTVSINTASILGAARASSRKIAEQAFQNYIAVLSVSLVALIPDISPPSLGITSVALTAVGMVLVLVRVPQIWRAPGNGRSNMRLLRRHGSSLVGFILLFYSSILMARGDQHHFNLFAASLIVLLAAATTVSWDLLVYLSNDGRAD